MIVETYLVYLLDVLSNTKSKTKELLLDAMPCSEKLSKELRASICK
ncbi:hypothetical protein [Clostridium sp.]|nr:hypothetical protein [Clostridium sp.]